MAHAQWINASAFSPDGRWLVSAGADVSLKIWDVASGSRGVHLLACTGDGVHGPQR